MADLGYLSLVIALALASYGAAAAFWGRRIGYQELVASGRNAAYAVGGLVTLATGVLVHAFVTHDFGIRFVAENSSLDLPLFYRFTALWGGHAGSLLLWAWILSLFIVGAVYLTGNRSRELMAYAVSVLLGTMVFFLLLLVFLSNPFEKLGFVPADGLGLNPLLQNPAMAIHPPLLYLGFVGFSVPYGFAMAALISGRLDASWVKLTRRWTLAAWAFLSLGITLGAMWAYMELGWGGFWGWDPVENSSFLPWLSGTAFLHSVMIQERRGMLKVWNMVLIILTYELALFGTFVTRSGIIDSVHAFADSLIGPVFLAFIGVTLLTSIFLLYSRLSRLKSQNRVESVFSREVTFLLNNLLFVGAAFAIFWGNIYPMVSEAVRGTKVTVGAPFFNQVAAPIFGSLLLLLGLCILIGWRRTAVARVGRAALGPSLIALTSAGVVFVVGVRLPLAVVGIAIISFAVAVMLREFVAGAQARRSMTGEGPGRALMSLVGRNRRRYGGYLVHLGVLLVATGILASNLYQEDRVAALRPGESMSVGEYTLVYDDLAQYRTANIDVLEARMTVFSGGQPLGVVRPQKNFHRNADQPMTEVDILRSPRSWRTILLEDVYVILAGLEDGGTTATFRVFVNPLVSWIWLGALGVLFGVVVAGWPDASQKMRVPDPLVRQPASAS
ncbi:MAG: heme lyase CcmF/NrfE family subunit [Anaerolineae bacterium]